MYAYQLWGTDFLDVENHAHFVKWIRYRPGHGASSSRCLGINSSASTALLAFSTTTIRLVLLQESEVKLDKEY
jgi:hypothetical protein